MKRIPLALFLVLFTFCASAQNFPLKVILNNGPPSRNINLVFLPDGYTATQMEKFLHDVDTIIDDMCTKSPFKEYKAYFNVYAILVPSNQSGATHPQTTNDSDCYDVPRRTNVNNYFGSTYDFGNVHRALVQTEDAKVASVLADNFPLYDQVYVLVNSPYHGGTGSQGGIATSNMGNGSADVVMHELGHAFGGLEDEYWSGSPGEAPNMTIHSGPSVVKWQNWIGTSGVGTYSFEESSSWYRPHNNCRMRYNNSNFCPVCRETLVEMIHSYADALVSYSPTERELFVPEGEIEFSVDVKKPDPNTLKIKWVINGEELSAEKNKTDITLAVNSLQRGRNTLEVQVVDTTLMTRSEGHLAAHLYKVLWKMDTENVTAIEVHSERSEYEIKIYPNPVEEQLTVSYTLSKKANINIGLIGGDGKQVKTLVNEEQLPGTHTYSMLSKHLDINTSGLYYLVLTVDGSSLVQKLIRK